MCEARGHIDGPGPLFALLTLTWARPLIPARVLPRDERATQTLLMKDREDHRQRRCPKLGHEVQFRYCRTQEANRLCPRILDCWWELFEVEGFLSSCYASEEVERLARPALQPKLSTILELIEAAKARAKSPPSPLNASEEPR